MSNLTTRVITGLFFGIVILSSIVFSSWLFLALFFCIAMVSLKEFYRLLQLSGHSPRQFSGMLAGAVIILSFIARLKGLPAEILLVNIPVFFLLFIRELYTRSEHPFRNIADTILGLLYVIIPFSLFITSGYFFGPAYSYSIPLGFTLLLWANDTGAYFVGISIGKHRLFERISPKKSWEGFFGGLITALLAGLALAYYFKELNLWQWEILALIVVIAGTFGDLVESMFKRSIAIKDSGSILPGHGGVLDRFDGFLLAVPFVFFFLETLRYYGII